MASSRRKVFGRVLGIRRLLVNTLGISLLLSISLAAVALSFLRDIDERAAMRADAALAEAEFAGLEQQISGFLVLLDLVVGADQTYLAEDVCQSARTIAMQVELLRDKRRWTPFAQTLLALTPELHAIDETIMDAATSVEGLDANRLLTATSTPSGRIVDLLDQLGASISIDRESLEEVAKRDERLGQAIAFATLATLFLIHLLTGIWTSRKIGKPIVDLHASAERAIAKGHFSATHGGPFEIRQLSERFDQLVTGLEEEVETRSQQILANEKLAAVGEMSAHLAHEINGYLTVLLLNSEDLQQEASASPESGEIARLAEENIQTIDSVVAVIEGLRTLSRDSSGDPLEPSPVAPLVEGCLAIAKAKADRRKVKLMSLSVPDALMIRARPAQISQVLLNLLGNAIDACAGAHTGGEARLEVRAFEDVVEFAVLDNGPGVPDGREEEIFDAFFTTKSVGDGTGLGLSIGRRIADAHSGSLTYQRSGDWTCFRLKIPREADA